MVKWLGPATSLELRSDSLGVLSAIANMASRTVEKKKIIAEIAIMEAAVTVSIMSLTQVPDISNDTPDAPPRLWAPGAMGIPAQLEE